MKLFHLLAALAAFAGSARAASVTITNSSFEADVLTSGGWNDNAPTGWTDPEGNSGSNFMEFIPSFASEGNNHLGFNGGLSMVYQDLGTAWAPNTMYTLTVGVGNRTNFGAGTGRFGFWSTTDAAPAAGAPAAVLTPTVYFSDVNTATVATTGQTFADAVVSFTTGAVVPAGNIRLSVQQNSGTRIHIDNLRLDATPVPEPTVTGTAVLAALGLTMLRRRRA